MAGRVTGSVREFFDLRVPNSEFEDRPWRIHEFLDGFRVEDVWALPTPGGPDDLATLVRYATSSDNAMLKASPLVNWLFSVRWRLGKALGWVGERQQVGTQVESLRDQLPEDLRVRRGTDMELAPFRSLFLTDDEWTAEFSASIGHIVMHHGWVRGENGVRYSQMTSLVMRVRSRGQFCADADGDSFPATELACELLLRNHRWTDDCSSTTMDTW